MPRDRSLHDVQKLASPKRALKALSLFTGAGGLDLGLEAAGFEIAGCVEMNDDARRTLAANRPSWPLATPGDIHARDPNDLVTSYNLRQGEVALVSGGPPCQPFSKSAFWVNGAAPGMRDPRATTLRAYLGVVEAALPDAMLLENVKGIAYSRSKRADDQEEAALDVLTHELDAINARHGTKYTPHVIHLDAARYGVPQHRERVFVFAAREGASLSLPNPTHGDPSRHGDAVLRFATAWDVLAELDDGKNNDPALKLTGYWAELLPSVPEGHNYLWHTPRGGGVPLFGWRTKYWSFLLKLAKLRPSWTLQALPGPATGPFHWRNRRLSIEEMARLQTFPRDARRIEGSYFSARRQVGNAVPSAVGELLGLVMRRQTFGETSIDYELSLVPDLLDDHPRRHPVQKVPAKYHVLRGAHADHPGVGKGPRAVKRVQRAA
jgi:DNA (cytosine-5)-methyltransferase 1